MINKVIFDMDGLLIDTEGYFSICWRKACAVFGYELTYEQGLYLRSLDSKLADKYFKQLFGDRCSYDDIRRKRKEFMNDMVTEKGITAKKGANELLQYLSGKGIETVLATSSNLERAKNFLKVAKIENSFTYIVSTAMVERGKPFPDVYLEACKKVGEAPCDCVAIEDSPNGVLSAYSAGCKVIMVPDLTKPYDEDRHMLYAVADSLSDVIDILENGLN